MTDKSNKNQHDKTIGYIRPKDCDEDIRAFLSACAQKYGLSVNEYVISDNFDATIDICSSGMALIVPEIDALGKSCAEIKKNIELAYDKGIRLITAAENYDFQCKAETKILLCGMAMFIRFHNRMVSNAVREKLSDLKKQGKCMGRPFSAKWQHLTEHSDEIEMMLVNGAGKSAVARKFGVSWSMINRFCRMKIQ